jgi:A/G-specific adenine glycosylase
MLTHAKDDLPKIDAKIARAFHRDLAQWYTANHRDLPWRREPTPYHVAISEFMCQQTQIATVLPYYARWMKAFPDWQALAGASGKKVLKHWEGLGYYNRARNLHKLAKLIINEHGGHLPANSGDLQQLPGIGPYTAAAIASISRGEHIAVLDGNVERVLTRAFALPWNVTQPAVKQRLRQLANQLLPAKNCGDHNQAMMELGALTCTPRNPQCLLCPLTTICHGKISPEQFPAKTKTQTTKEQQQIAIIIKNRKIWLLNPGEPGRWQGFHRLPLLDEKNMIPDKPLTAITYSITRYRVNATAIGAKFRKNEPESGSWLELSELESVSLPAPHRKILASLNSTPPPPRQNRH